MSLAGQRGRPSPRHLQHNPRPQLRPALCPPQGTAPAGSAGRGSLARPHLAGRHAPSCASSGLPPRSQYSRSARRHAPHAARTSSGMPKSLPKGRPQGQSSDQRPQTNKRSLKRRSGIRLLGAPTARSRHPSARYPWPGWRQGRGGENCHQGSASNLGRLTWRPAFALPRPFIPCGFYSAPWLLREVWRLGRDRWVAGANAPAEAGRPATLAGRRRGAPRGRLGRQYQGSGRLRRAPDIGLSARRCPRGPSPRPLTPPPPHSTRLHSATWPLHVH